MYEAKSDRVTKIETCQRNIDTFTQVHALICKITRNEIAKKKKKKIKKKKKKKKKKGFNTIRHIRWSIKLAIYNEQQAELNTAQYIHNWCKNDTKLWRWRGKFLQKIAFAFICNYSKTSVNKFDKTTDVKIPFIISSLSLFLSLILLSITNKFIIRVHNNYQTLEGYIYTL